MSLKWLTFVRLIIEKTGKIVAWQNQTPLQNSALKHEIKQVLIDQNLQHKIDARSVNQSA